MQRKNIFGAVTVAAVIAISLVGYHKLLRWKRFEVVEDRILYRSGILADWQLRRAIKLYGIKTVFSFTHTNNRQEDETCRELGVNRHFCYLNGDGVGTDDPYLRFLQVVQEPSNHPVLVHCSAGVQRTGGAVLLYRCFFQDWPFDDAVKEMIAKGNDGNLPQIEQLRSIHDRLSQTAAATAEVRRGSWH